MKKGKGFPFPRSLPVLSGGVCGFVAYCDTLLEPVVNFAFYPADAVRAESYPFRELPYLLQSVDMLRAIQHQLTQLLLRQDPHHEHSQVGECHDTPGLDKPLGIARVSK